MRILSSENIFLVLHKPV